MLYIQRHTLLAALLLLCSGAASVAQPAIAGGDRAVVAGSALPFGADILRALVKATPEGNIFIAPFSISTALGMLLNGTRGTGADSMMRVMHLPKLTPPRIAAAFGALAGELERADSGVAMRSGNSIWYAGRFFISDSFRASVAGPYRAEIRSVDFTSKRVVDEINGWVKQRTEGKIPELLDAPPGPDVMMMLINAIYFKGSWARKFDEKLTRDETFTTAVGAGVTCRMMHSHDTYEYFDDELLQGVDIPYGDGRFTMTVLLPKPGKSVDAVAAQLGPESWGRWRRRVRQVDMELGLPKFRMECTVELLDHLKKLGMLRRGTDLSGLGGAGMNLFVSSVLHKTFVEVNEEGTEAAAITAITVVSDSGEASVPPLSFVVNRPSLFIIRERETGALLFIGKLADPR